MIFNPDLTKQAEEVMINKKMIHHFFDPVIYH